MTANPLPLESIKLKDCIIAYIDVLGTKSIITSDNENKVTTFIHNLSELYQDMSEIFFEKRIFSDNIIIFDNYSEENLERIIDLSCKTQYYLLMKYKLTSRGGIVRGKLYHDENFVIGKGLVDAYNLESKEATTPRIILSSDLPHDLSLTCKSISDDKIMVDYMRLLCDEDNDFPIYDQVAVHRQILQDLSTEDRSEMSSEERKRTDFKYARAIQYHNRFCQENDLEELMIDLKEVGLNAI